MGVTSRTYQFANYELGIGILNTPTTEFRKFCSVTTGFRDFAKTKPIMDPSGMGVVVGTEDIPEETVAGTIKGFERGLFDNNITYVSMFLEAPNPLVIVAPDIEWYLELGLVFTEETNELKVVGFVTGKEFPAYEAIIEDGCGEKAFLHTMTAPSEDKLGSELLWPFPDYNEPIDFRVILDDNGCFTDEAMINQEVISLQQWNLDNLIKSTALDCPQSPC